MFFFLKTLSYLLLPFIWIYGKFRQYQNLETSKRFWERFGISTHNKENKNYVWFHAASVGEVSSIVSLVKQFSKAHPSFKILITTTTVTGDKTTQKLLNNICIHQFIPYDTAWGCKNFLNTWKPKIAIFVESEVWPIMLKTLNKNKIPTILINACISLKSIQRWQQFPWFAKRVFQNFNLITTSSKNLLLQFKQWNVADVLEMAHLKYFAKPLPYKKNLYEKFYPFFQSRQNWLAVSTHSGEEDIVLNVHKQLKEIYPHLLTIIIPRHPHRHKKIQESCHKMGIHSALYSHNVNLNNVDILIIERIGVTGLFYALSPINLIGGSLVNGIGGHNPIEAGLFKNTLLWGPYIYKSQDIYSTLKDTSYPVSNENDLINTLDKLFKSSKTTKELGEKTYQVIQQQAHSLENYVRIFDPYLK